jgi:hypothetical protein
MRLRDVELGEVSAYVRMRCDPVMMAGLGGPLPREGIEDKVARDVQAAAAGGAWIKMIVPGEAAPDVVAGRSRCGPATRRAASRLPRSAGWSCRSSRDAGSPSGPSGCFSSWPAMTAAGGWCMRSWRRRTARRTVSAGPSASGSPGSGMSPSPGVFCGAATESSTLPPT